VSGFPNGIVSSPISHKSAPSPSAQPPPLRAVWLWRS
jgi:hypothetical protein